MSKIIKSDGYVRLYNEQKRKMVSLMWTTVYAIKHNQADRQTDRQTDKDKIHRPNDQLTYSLADMALCV